MNITSISTPLSSGKTAKDRMVEYVLMALVFINPFIVTATFRVRDVNAGMDIQVLMKLAIWMLSLGFCAMLYRAWSRRAVSIENIFAALLLVIILFSCTYAPKPAYSMGAAFSVISTVLLFYTASAILDERVILRMVFYSLSTVIVISIFYYFAIPSVGRMQLTGTTYTIGTRLSGITGTPNTAGFTACCALLIGFFYWKDHPSERSPLFYLLVLANIVVLVLSDSRTSQGGLMLALAFAYFIKPTLGRLSLMLLGGALLLSAYAMIDFDVMFASLSRSGDASEITSGTGRTSIWRVVIDLIALRPWTGWGYSSADFILPQYANLIGHKAPSAHNLFLQILLTVGFPGLIIFLAMYSIQLFKAVSSQSFFKAAILFLLLINGLTEPSVFRGVASISTVMLAIAISLDYRRKKDTSSFRSGNE